MENINALPTTEYSVIVPVYNSQKTIAACMNSILLAMRSDVELLLIDNGSTDDSAQVIREVTQSKEWPTRISYFYEKHGGVSGARNSGIQAAQGKYLIFLDSDDELMSTFFTELDQTEDVDLIIYRMDMGPKLEIAFPELENLSFEEKLIPLLSAGVLHSASNKRFKKALIDRIQLRFDESLTIGEDFLFSMRYCMYCNNLQILDKYLYKVNSGNPNSLSRAYRPKLTELLIRLYELQEKNLTDCPFSEEIRVQLLREMDYYHSKAVCSCIAETFKADLRPYFMKRELFQRIGQAFDTPLAGAQGYCGPIHCFLNWLLANHIIYPIYVVTALKKAAAYRHYRREEKKKRQTLVTRSSKQNKPK